MPSIKKLVNAAARPFGVEVVRKKTARTPSGTDRLQHAKNLGFAPKVIFDVGAFDGSWSAAVAKIFPGAILVLIEPNPYVLDKIRKSVSQIVPAPIVLNIAVGDKNGTASFNIWGNPETAVGASLLDHVSGKPDTTLSVKMETLDSIANRLGLMPDLVKLDLQGAELLALIGGGMILAQAEFWICEFGCLEAYEKRATPKDLLDVMYSNNYRLYDIVECHYRPFDQALTGGDFFFVKNSSILLQHKGWK